MENFSRSTDAKPDIFLRVPLNKVLYIQKFTYNDSIKPEIVEGPRTLEGIFSHFNPSFKIELFDPNGEDFEECFQFNSIEDFEIKELINQSFLLRYIRAEIDQHVEMYKQLKANKLLENVMGDPYLKQAFISALKFLVLELEDIVTSESEKDYFEPGSAGDYSSIPPLQHSLNILEKAGGFNFLEETIDSLTNMHPQRKAKRSIFLTDEWQKQPRL